MKTILKLISIMVFMVYSSLALALTEEDPNNAQGTTEQTNAGVFVPGADLSKQVKSCPKCQNLNKLRLGDPKDIYVPGMAPSNSDPTSDSSSHK